MKTCTLILLLLLCPLFMLAQFYKGSVVYTNGNVKQGFVEEPFYSANRVKFKATEDGKTEKIKSEELTGLAFTTEGGAEKKYASLPGAGIGFGFKGNTIPAGRLRGNLWFRVVKESEKLNLLMLTFDYGTMMVFAGEDKDAASGNIYFLQVPGESTAGYAYDNGINAGYEVSDVAVLQKNLKKISKKSEWVAFADSLTQRSLAKKGIVALIDLYNSFEEPQGSEGLKLDKL